MMDEVRRFAAELSASTPTIPPGEAIVLLTVGDEARVLTALHLVTAPLKVPAATIAEQAGLPVNELPGRRFAVATVTEDAADGFTLLDDPRL